MRGVQDCMGRRWEGGRGASNDKIYNFGGLCYLCGGGAYWSLRGLYAIFRKSGGKKKANVKTVSVGTF